MSNLENAQFGFSVSTAGDVNGDGYADIIVGAPYYDNGQVMEGWVWVYRGSETGLVPEPYWHKQADRANTLFGWSVASAGDVNNDGYDDVLVGAPGWEDGAGGADEGGAWIYRGSSSGPVDVPYWHKETNLAGANFGWSVAGAGDVNGDGYADVIIGAPEYTADYTNEGLAFVYPGSSTGVSSVPGWSFKGGEANAALGTSVASAGDVHRDGFSDVIVGAPMWDDSERSGPRRSRRRTRRPSPLTEPAHTSESSSSSSAGTPGPDIRGEKGEGTEYRSALQRFDRMNDGYTRVRPQDIHRAEPPAQPGQGVPT